MNVALGFSAIQYCLHIHVRCLLLFSEPGVSLGRIQNLTSPESIKEYYHKHMDALRNISSALDEANAPEKFKYALNVIFPYNNNDNDNNNNDGIYSSISTEWLFICWNMSY